MSMTTLQFDNKGVQTDTHRRHTYSKLLKKLQTYLIAVNRYRLYLFSQYNQSDESYEYEDLVNVRKQILDRFEWVMKELEKVVEGLQVHRLSIGDVEESIDRSLIKEVIEAALTADFPTEDTGKEILPNKDEWKLYKRDLRETKEDLFILDLFVHRGISKIDGLMNVTNLYM